MIDETIQLIAEKNVLEKMLADLPESSIIDRLSLEARLVKILKKISELEP